MISKGFKMILVLVLTLQLTGCVTHRDIDTMNFVLGAAFDYNDQTKQYQVYVQVPRTQTFIQGGGGGEDQGQFLIFTGQGETIFDSIRDVAKSSQMLFWGHCQIFIVGKGLADKGVYELMDFLTRDNEIRDEAYFMVANAPLEKLLTIKGAQENVSLYTINTLLEDSLDVHGEGVEVRVRDITNQILKWQSTYLVSLVDIKAEPLEAKEAPEKYLISGAAVFKGDRQVGILTPQEAWNYNLVRNQLRDTLVTFDYDGNKLVVEQIAAKTKVTPIFNGSEITLAIDVKVRGNVGNLGEPINLKNPAIIQQIKKAYEQRVGEILMNSIKRAKEKRLDYFGFGREIEMAQPEVWAQVQERWEEEIFPEVPVQIKVEGTVVRTGLTITTRPREKYANGK